MKSVEEWKAHYLRVRETLIPRSAPKLPDRNLALAIVGIRRCGKTSIAIQASAKLAPDKVFYYNFEDPLFYQYPEVKYLDDLLSLAEENSKSKFELLILDEIQNIAGWERWLRKQIDFKKYRIIVTGSSARLLSSEIATSLTGRCIEHRISTLGWSELDKFNPVLAELTEAQKLRQYLTWGGFPEVIKSDSEERKSEILRGYLNDITLKDIVQRNSIRNPQALNQIITYYLTNTACLHSHNAVSKACNVNEDTVGAYTRACEEAFLFAVVSRYNNNLKIVSRSPKKIYTADLGLRQIGARSASLDNSKLFENLVYQELARRHREIHYFKEEHEIDFLITENSQPCAIYQACYDISDSKTETREVQAIIEAAKINKLKKAVIVTANQNMQINKPGVKIEVMAYPKWVSDS